MRTTSVAVLGTLTVYYSNQCKLISILHPKCILHNVNVPTLLDSCVGLCTTRWFDNAGSPFVLQLRVWVYNVQCTMYAEFTKNNNDNSSIFITVGGGGGGTYYIHIVL